MFFFENINEIAGNPDAFQKLVVENKNFSYFDIQH